MSYILFIMWGRSSNSFFACGDPVVPVPFVKKAILSPLNYLNTFVKSQLTRDVWVNFWTEFYSIDLQVCPYTSITLYWSFYGICQYIIYSLWCSISLSIDSLLDYKLLKERFIFSFIKRNHSNFCPSTIYPSLPTVPSPRTYTWYLPYSRNSLPVKPVYVFSY